MILTRPFKVLAVGPYSAADIPDGRTLGDKLMELDLPSNLADRANNLRVAVACYKPCANPYDMPRSLPRNIKQYVVHTFVAKAPPYHVTTDVVSTPPILIKVANITGHQYVRNRGHTVVVLYETHRKGISRPTRQRELDLKGFRHKLLACWGLIKITGRPTFGTIDSYALMQLALASTAPLDSLRL